MSIINRPPAVGDLLEREGALAALEEAFDEARAGHGRLVLVAAEAGGGKTSVVVAGRLDILQDQ